MAMGMTEHRCRVCGTPARWRVRSGNLFAGEYAYYCDKCKEEATIREK